MLEQAVMRAVIRDVKLQEQRDQEAQLNGNSEVTSTSKRHCTRLIVL